MRIESVVPVNIFTKKPSFCAAPKGPMQQLPKDEFCISNPKYVTNLPNIQKYPIKAVFSDIDGTILHDHKLVLGNLRATKGLKRAGIPLILATGRNRTEAQPMLDLLGVEHPPYLITEQGGTVFRGEEIIFKDTMSLEDTLDSIRAAQEYVKKDGNMQLLLHINGQSYAADEKVIDGYTHAKESVKLVNSFDEALAQGMPTKIVLFKTDSTHINDLNDARDFLKERLGGRSLNIFNAGRHFCEITNNSISKGKAIRIIAQDMGIDLKNTAALGDAENDLEMIKLVSEEGGLSVAMGNAIPELKAQARVITDDAKESGWARAVEAMLRYR